MPEEKAVRPAAPGNRLKKSTIFLAGCLAVLSGVAVAPLAGEKFLSFDLGLFGATVLFCLAAIFCRRRRLKICWLLAACLTLGVWRYSLLLGPPAPTDLAYYNGQHLIFSALVVSDNASSGSASRLRVRAEETLDGRFLGGLAEVTLPNYPFYDYGDRLRLGCQLVKPAPLDDFAYDRYLARYGVFSLCLAPTAVLLAREQGNFILSSAFKTKNKIIAIIKRFLPYPHANLAASFVLGSTVDLPPELKAAFSRTGLSHLVAVSGMNVSLLTLMLFEGLLFFGWSRRAVFWLTSGLLWFYVILVGAPASALRAGIMGWLVLVGGYLGRLSKLTNALVATAALMILINPRLLRDDVGWQLSFLALLGIIYFYPVLKRHLKSRQRAVDCLLDLLALTLAAQLLTWPIIAYDFKQISVVAPLANLLTVWLAPIFFLGVLGGVILSWLMPVYWWWWPLFWLLDYFLKTTQLLGAWPLAARQLSGFNVWWLTFYYPLLFVLLWLSEKFGGQRSKRLSSDKQMKLC